MTSPDDRPPRGPASGVTVDISAHSTRLGIAEWIVGLLLIFGSLTGPWLTILFPVSLLFVIHDQRSAARLVGALLMAGVAALTVAVPAGTVLLLSSAAAIVAVELSLGRREGPFQPGELAGPVLVVVGVAVLAAALVWPAALIGWEETLSEGVTRGAERAIDQYRSLGMDPATLEGLEAVAEGAVTWIVRLWPALVGVSLWLGAWLAYRILGRWGRPSGRLAGRFPGSPFRDLRVPEGAAWILIATLVSLWIPHDGVSRVAGNALMALAVVYSLAGLGVVAWGMAKMGWGPGWRAISLILLFAFLAPVLFAACFGLGLADHWLRIRERVEASETRR